MPNDQVFVASITVFLSIASFVAAVGDSTAPYKMRVAALIQQRFGKRAARVFYAILAVILLAMAAVIYSDVRPGFAISH
ncbi:MAG: hypothetical protein R3C05_15965 [Pirellulaceae bacterium]